MWCRGQVPARRPTCRGRRSARGDQADAWARRSRSGTPTTASPTPTRLASWATRSGPSIRASVRKASVRKRPTEYRPRYVRKSAPGAREDSAVYGEPAPPDGGDLGGKAAVIVEVEGDVVEARADEAADEGQLRCLEQVVGVEAAPLGLVVGEPEPERHRARHENAVPAEGQGAELEGNGPRRVEHTGLVIRPGTDAVK